MQIFYGRKRKKGERRSWKVTFEMKHTRDVSKLELTLWIIIKLVLLSEKTSESAAIRPGGPLHLRSHPLGPQPLRDGRRGTRGAGAPPALPAPSPAGSKGSRQVRPLSSPIFNSVICTLILKSRMSSRMWIKTLSRIQVLINSECSSRSGADAHGGSYPQTVA